MKPFIVYCRDLFDRHKNPSLSLSPRDVLNNKKIKKRSLSEFLNRGVRESETNQKEKARKELLDELVNDVYGYDLRNWDERAITKQSIKERYENIDNDFPIVSASRYFTFVLPNLKKVHNVSVEKIIEIIMQSREQNWRQLAEQSLHRLKGGIRWYFMYPDDSDPEYLGWCYQEYLQYCELLKIKPLSKREIYDSIKIKYNRQKNGA
jgi:hypothetical protein